MERAVVVLNQADLRHCRSYQAYIGNGPRAEAHNRRGSDRLDDAEHDKGAAARRHGCQQDVGDDIHSK